MIASKSAFWIRLPDSPSPTVPVALRVSRTRQGFKTDCAGGRQTGRRAQGRDEDEKVQETEETVAKPTHRIDAVEMATQNGQHAVIHAQFHASSQRNLTALINQQGCSISNDRTTMQVHRLVGPHSVMANDQGICKHGTDQEGQKEQNAFH